MLCIKKRLYNIWNKIDDWYDDRQRSVAITPLSIHCGMTYLFQIDRFAIIYYTYHYNHSRFNVLYLYDILLLIKI